MSTGTEPPLVTVLLPVYNSAPFLKETLDSIFAQSWEHFELLAIDDASTDGSLDILRSITDPRLRLVAHGSNQGLIASLNEGLSLARGRYVARMDGDDLMHPERLAQQVEHLEQHPELALVASFVEYINTDGEVTGTWSVDRATPDEASVAAMLPRTNCLAHPTVMLRREALGDLRYDPRQQGAEDWDLWLRMRSRGLRLGKLPEALLQYRQHAASMMGIQKMAVSYERRLMRTRWRFLTGEWAKGRTNVLHLAVLKAQTRTLARHLRFNVLQPALRDLKRILSYSPIALWREGQALDAAVRQWKGGHIFFFPYLSTGGAEQVHADILGSVSANKPLVVMCGRSRDRAFAGTYAERGRLLEIPRLLHHPFTRRKAHARLAALINAQERPVLFSSLTSNFFELLHLLKPEVRTFHLQHAFLYQADGNVQHKQWLRHFERITGYVFISGQAKAEFEKFLFANQVPRSRFGKLHWIPNAVHAFGALQEHERIGLLFVGRPSPEKRLDLFLALAQRLEREFPGRFRYTVVGAEALPGHAHVQFLGTVSDRDRMASTYAANDLLVLTSYREGFPLVIMEAMAQGLGVLSTPVGDVPARLNSEHAVVSTSVEASVVLEEFATVIIALDRDRQRLQALKAAALAKARIEFDMERFRASYRALLSAPAS